MEVLQTPSELKQARALYVERQPRRVLEIGCWDGGTLREWLKGGTPELVVAVSLEHRQPKAYRKWTHKDTQLIVGTGDSNSDEMVGLIRELAPYDWAFIDGEHQYDFVRHDVDVVLPLMRTGGVILLHDVTPDQFGEVTGPRRVFEELEKAGYTTEVYDDEPLRWSAGIGVVYV